MKKTFLPPLLFLLLTLINGVAQADNYGSYSRYSSPFDFSLQLVSTDLALQADGIDMPVSLDRISFEVFTLLEPKVQFGFITGSSYLHIDDDPASAGLSLGGYHLGLVMRSSFGHNPQLGLHAQYLYQEAKDETDTQSVVLSWHEWAAGLSGRVLLGQQLELSAGLTLADVDARRRARGDINETKTLKLGSTTQRNLGIAWLTTDGGRVSLMLQRGDYKQVIFGFSRRFR